MADPTIKSLAGQLRNLEGSNGQNFQTGANANGKSFVGDYSNRLFGAPYQLLDSVDRRFKEINPNLGNEYLMNFMLNSPILHIRPGMPKYTGNVDKTSLSELVKNIYGDVVSASSGQSLGSSIFNTLGTALIFGAGKKLQSRMFGFKETYYEYIQYVNYMCRSAATYMDLVNSDEYPKGCYTSGGNFETFDVIDWQNYRIGSEGNASPIDQLKKYADVAADNVGGAVAVIGGITTAISNAVNGALSLIPGIETEENTSLDEWMEAAKQSAASSILGQIESKLSAVEFMVEPISFSETLKNNTKNSTIESMIEGVTSGVGTEIAWITNSDADTGVLGGLSEIIGASLEGASEALAPLVRAAGGGFTRNLFSGAIASLKGQKMIYPKIYDSSESTMNYQFSMTLTTPYGDPYNYYMNIVVPLIHLIALVAPRMVSANTVSSPFLVQAYIPGMCTCQLGIISDMTITKNPSMKHVSVNGFPLSVKVEFTVEELYNSMAISPANDPASFLYNETLNDYLCNMSGLAPSLDTYAKQRNAKYQAAEKYFTQGLFAQDWVSGAVEWVENAFISGSTY